ncbi:hypothetical protein Cpap_1522 [Ruminiclostridium papyrosolvens DSM 2782]|uniref:Uncharacterized protein n=1 Tax=Ruminiclostridium papyrosolvens DSM 2782 TaxID=588581 RepID=F1TEG4_9FIRM|nr:hypothetical protein Cpap_1522 [Ruminiclostridium papyrosolvens DSM 2782]
MLTNVLAFIISVAMLEVYSRITMKQRCRNCQKSK